MFNKSNIFPKSNESPASRVQSRTVGTTTAETAVPRDPFASSSGGAQAVPRTQPAAARDASESGGSRLIVGPEVKLKGAEILDCDTLVVEGRVAATMDSRVLRIAESGAFEGKVGVDVAEIHGRFDGELTAREQLVIHAGGRVNGKIRYGSILIEEGGQICGDISSENLDAQSGKSTNLSSATTAGEKVEAVA